MLSVFVVELEMEIEFNCSSVGDVFALSKRELSIMDWVRRPYNISYFELSTEPNNRSFKEKHNLQDKDEENRSLRWRLVREDSRILCSTAIASQQGE